MTETNVFELTQPGAFSDPLTEVLRNGARTLLGQAVEAEVAAWLSTHTDKLTDDGGLFGAQHVGDLVEQARDASGDGTTELAFVPCGIPPMNRSVLSTVSVGSGHSLMAPE